MRKIKLDNGLFYHIYNRGVLGSNIFVDSGDYARFIHYLYHFNTQSPASQTKRKLQNFQHVRGPASDMLAIVGRLVDIVCYCLMPNHFHLILRQIIDNGIRKFMHKVETGHAMFFNKKYDRSGVLYQGRFQAILIEEDEYLTHLSRYIHLNPVDLIEPGWKENGIKDWESVNKFLESYKWSSYQDYIGKHNFPSVLNKEPLGWYFKSSEQYKSFVQSWMYKDIGKIKEMMLDE